MTHYDFAIASAVEMGVKIGEIEREDMILVQIWENNRIIESPGKFNLNFRQELS